MLKLPDLTPGFRKFTDSIERDSGYGFFAADFTIHGPIPDDVYKVVFPLAEAGTQQLKIVSLLKPESPMRGVYKNLTLECELDDHSLADKLPVRIDSMLSRYGIKHQKSWAANTLNWSIASGHAKKNGIAHITLDKAAPIFTLKILSLPPEHLLRSLDLPLTIKINGVGLH